MKPHHEREPAVDVAIAPPTSKLRRLTRDERKQLGEDIHAAIKQARPHGATEGTGTGVGGPAPTLAEEPLLDLEAIGPSVKAALETTIPEFQKCYEGQTAANKAPIAIMELVSDPDLGTVIDGTQMIDADGSPLPKTIEDCLRDTADSLSLPPLGQPGRLPIQYNFRFDRD
ncbi:hypothetical protein BH11MYX1_BH11MYX1_07940 [soil metagenome]